MTRPSSIELPESLPIRVEKCAFNITSVSLAIVLLTWGSSGGSLSSSPSAPAEAAADGPYGAHLPIVVRDAPLSVPWRYTPDADFVLGGPAMAVDVAGDVAFAGIGAHVVALDIGSVTTRDDGRDAVDGDHVVGASPPLPGYVTDIEIVDGLAFVAVAQGSITDVNGGLFVLNVSDPKRIEVIGHGPIPGGADHIALRGNVAILLSYRVCCGGIREGFSGATHFDISDPTFPRVMASNFGANINSAFRTAAVFDDRVVVCTFQQNVLDLDSFELSDSGQDALFEVELDACDAVLAYDDILVAVTGLQWRLPTETPSLKLIDMSEPSRPVALSLLELPIVPVTSWDDDAQVHGITRIDNSVAFVGVHQTAGSFAIVIDVSDPLHPTITEHRDLPLGALDISGDESRLVVAGSPVPEGAWPAFADTVELSEHFLLGGRADVFERADAPSGPSHTLLEGPATTIPYVALHEDTVFALEVDALSGLTGEPSSRGALWRFDLTHGYPRVQGVLRMDEMPDPFGAIDGIGTRFAASSRLVALSTSDVARLFDTSSGGSPIAAGELAIDGTFALQDDRLFVTSYGEILTFDVSDPTRPSEVGRLESEDAHAGALAVTDDLLWISDRMNRILTIDVGDPTLPNVLGSIEVGRLIFGIVAEGEIAVAISEAGVHVFRSDSRGDPIVTDELAFGGPLGFPSFDLAMHDGRAWIALGSEESVTWLQLDVREPGDLSVARTDGPPAGMLARMAWVEVPESGSQLEANDRWLIGAHFGAGLFGRWSRRDAP